VTIASDLTSLFPVLLQLYSKGKGVRNLFPRCVSRAVSYPKLQFPGFGGRLEKGVGCCENRA